MEKEPVVISAEKVSKVYTLRHNKPTFFETVMSKRTVEQFKALDAISFSITQGERVAIIGSNGSGKTTLLKLVAGITQPTSGKMRIRGRVASLIDLEAGFHPDLSGEENIFLNGMLVGMSKAEIREKLPQIVAFADIGQFIDAPLYTYSSGMKLRLGFAVAIHSDPEILLLDEGFAVGDGFFRDRVNKKILEFKKKKKTLIMVSHWIEELKRNCTKVIWLEKGKVKAQGGKKIFDSYSELF